MTLIVQDNQNKVRFAVRASNKQEAIQQALQKSGVTTDLKVLQRMKNGNLKKI